MKKRIAVVLLRLPGGLTLPKSYLDRLFTTAGSGTGNVLDYFGAVSHGRLDLTGIDWVIVGGESGPRARPIDPEWVREVRDQCLAKGVAFFFKQWGGLRPKSGATARRTGVERLSALQRFVDSGRGMSWFR